MAILKAEEAGRRLALKWITLNKPLGGTRAVYFFLMPQIRAIN